MRTTIEESVEKALVHNLCLGRAIPGEIVLRPGKFVSIDGIIMIHYWHTGTAQTYVGNSKSNNLTIN